MADKPRLNDYVFDNSTRADYLRVVIARIENETKELLEFPEFLTIVNNLDRENSLLVLQERIKELQKLLATLKNLETALKQNVSLFDS